MVYFTTHVFAVSLIIISIGASVVTASTAMKPPQPDAVKVNRPLPTDSMV